MSHWDQMNLQPTEVALYFFRFKDTIELLSKLCIFSIKYLQSSFFDNITSTHQCSFGPWTQATVILPALTNVTGLYIIKTLYKV
jgi:hypothetical protein